MVKFSKEIGPNHYRETFGRYFEDFKVGDIYDHLFTLMTLNTHPLHFDAEFGKGTEFKQNLVVSTYTLSLLIGMSVSDCSQKAVANLGMTDVKFTLPVFCGDTIYGSSEVLDKRESKSRKGQGIVEIKTTGTNQDNKVVCTFLRQILIPAKGHAVEDKIENY